MIAWDGPYCPYIHCAGDGDRPYRWAVRRRRLTQWLLVTSLDGDERIEVAGRGYDIPAGGSYLVQPGMLHDLASARNRPAWIHFDLSFDRNRRDHPQAGSYASELGPRRRFLQPDAQAVFGVDLPVEVPPALTPLFAAGVPRLVRRWCDGTRLATLDATHQLGALLLALVGHALREAGADASAPPAERIARAERTARDQLAAGIDVAGMAAAAGMSRGHFSTAYRRLRGATPAAFLRAQRLDLAAELLRRPDLDARSVGALVGYPEPTVFGRAFRARFGTTPGRWRCGVSPP